MKIICSRCKKEKDSSFFSLRENRKKGFNSWCKECVKDYDKIKYQENKEKRSRQKKERRFPSS